MPGRARPVRGLQAGHQHSHGALHGRAAGQPVQTTEDWEFAGANGERTGAATQIRAARRPQGCGRLKLFSGADPRHLSIVKLAQGLDPMRNHVPSRDTVSEFHTGYRPDPGQPVRRHERVVSIDSIHWNDRRSICRERAVISTR